MENKLYINITNHCNASCPFCCMSSGSNKQTFMSFDVFYGICKHISVPTIVQLEGGEPTTHPLLYLFLEFLASLDNIKEIVIDTNALTLSKQIDKIVDIATRNNKLITIKPSFNTFIETVFNSYNRGLFADYLTNIVSSCEFIDRIRFELNVRGYDNDELEKLKEKLPEKIRDISNFHLFNSYGRLYNNSKVPPLSINKVYAQWHCYASDGKCFGQDLIARAKYEFLLN